MKVSPIIFKKKKHSSDPFAHSVLKEKTERKNCAGGGANSGVHTMAGLSQHWWRRHH
jgi:hypothetical protein